MQKIKQKIKIAQDRQNNYADETRTHKEFKIGDHVYLRVKPRKYTLRIGTCDKMETRFYGPFDILDKVGLVEYQLALPNHIKVHTVFHV